MKKNKDRKVRSFSINLGGNNDIIVNDIFKSYPYDMHGGNTNGDSY